MEPRARAGRHKSSLNFGDELKQLLYAYGAPSHPDLTNPVNPPPTQTATLPGSASYLAALPTPNTHHAPTPFREPYPQTLRVLDEILTDFIIETCHNAVAVATYSGRAKLKLADFEFILRKDSAKLGRVQEMFRKKKRLDEQKKLFDTTEGKEGKIAVTELQGLGEVVGEEGTGKGKGRGRGRRKKREREAEDVAAAGGEGGEGAEAAGDGDEDERASKRAKSEVD